MRSVKSQIRQAVVERLKSDNLLSGRIFDTPLQTFEPEQLPLLIVTVEKDQVLDDWTSILMTTFAKNALIELRELSLHLTIVAKTSPWVVNELDHMATHITKVLLSDRQLGGLCKTLRVQAATDISTVEEAEKPVCSLMLHCLIWYRQVDCLPESPVA